MLKLKSSVKKEWSVKFSMEYMSQINEYNI